MLSKSHLLNKTINYFLTIPVCETGTSLVEHWTFEQQKENWKKKMEKKPFSYLVHCWFLWNFQNRKQSQVVFDALNLLTTNALKHKKDKKSEQLKVHSHHN